MNDLLTDSFAAGASASAAAAAGDEKLDAFLREAEAAKAEMAALRDELSRLQSAHEASMALLRPGAPRAATRAALLRLLASARRLRARLASMDRRAPAPAAVATTAGLRSRLTDLTAGVQLLRRQVSTDRRGDAARSYLAVNGEAPTEEQLDRILAAGGEVEEVEGGLLELQQMFLDMAALVESQGDRVDDIERHVAAAAGDVSAAEGEFEEARRLRVAARRRRLWLTAGLAVLLLAVLAAAAAALALALARRRKGGAIAAGGAADFSAW